jgi:hypothetical protein
MNDVNTTARRAGLLYLAMSILAMFSYLYVPAAFMVRGDAAATARRILEGELMYRVSVLTSLTTHLLFLFLVMALYRLFRDVDRAQARLMVVLVCVPVAAELVVVAGKLAPLVFLSDAEFLSVFSKPQLEALSLASLRLGGNLAQLMTVFWGLWLFPFGILTLRSGYFPKVLGILLFISGVGYIATGVAFLVLPEHLPLIRRILTPLYFGELGMVLWLPIMGARARRVAAA